MSDVLDAVRASGAVAILRLRAHDLAVDVVHALAAGGVRVVEMTMDDPGALDALEHLAGHLAPGVVLGAGTVRRPEQVARVAAAGGRFCVSPDTNPAVIRATLEAGLEPLPGAMTASEVATALDAGARAVKLFPAGVLGLAYLRALRGPFSDVDFVPTGGIRHDEVEGWLRAGALAVGLGSDLVPARPTDEDLEAIRRRAEVVVEQVAAAARAEP